MTARTPFAFRLFVVLAVLVAAGFTPAAALAFNPQPEPPALLAYGPFGLTPDQLVRVNVARLAPRAEGPSVPVAVMLVDAEGDVVETRELMVAPRQAAFHDVDGSLLYREHPELFGPAGAPARAQLRVVVDLHPPEPGRGSAAAPVQTSLEILDGTTGRTVVGWENPLVLRGFNPQPEPPARF